MPNTTSPPSPIHKALPLLSAMAVLTLLIVLGELLLANQTRVIQARQQIETLSFASGLRARVERELNAVLYLNNGLGSYFIVRRGDLPAREVRDILAVLHERSQHIRNFSVAIGHRVAHVYPLAGNELLIGLHYRDLAEQWPLIERIAGSGKPALTGPLNLLQGGSGLIYRVPLLIDGRYWGMLSTVIDTDAFFRATFAEMVDTRFDFAIRGKNGLGMKGALIWGPAELFTRQGVTTREILIPGGSWVFAIAPRHPDSNARTPWLLRGLGWPLAALIGGMLYMLIHDREKMARLAMYDLLTGLPNRLLLDDRVNQAINRQQRGAPRSFAVLFLDLDGFKAINDEWGHKAGDFVLRTVANRARQAARQVDTVARWGGDEFIVLVETPDPARLEILSKRLRAEIERPIPYEQVVLRVGVSIGLAWYPEDGADLDQILKSADRRMYGEKYQRQH